MTFLANPLRLPPDDVVRYVLGLDKRKLTWKPVGVTWHNSGNPNLTRWSGYPEKVKEAWGRNYDFYCHVTQHWHAGPHGMGTPDGWAFILGDLLADGVHASCFNRDHYGFETVGDFSHGADDPSTGAGLASMQSTANLIASVCAWLDLDPDEAINFHRMCEEDHHACPGSLVTPEFAKGLVKSRLGAIKNFSPTALPVLPPVSARPAETWSAHPLGALDKRLWLQRCINAHGQTPPLIVDGDIGEKTIDAMAGLLTRIPAP